MRAPMPPPAPPLSLAPPTAPSVTWRAGSPRSPPAGPRNHLQGEEKMKYSHALLAGACAMSFPLAHAADKAAPHWGYEGEAGPAGWGKEFPTCGLGKAQSPID